MVSALLMVHHPNANPDRGCFPRGPGVMGCSATRANHDRRWITQPPTRCPNGHPRSPNQALVGHVACLGHGGGGHTSWHCRPCDTVLYGPPMNTHCTALEGPAAVRISTLRGWTSAHARDRSGRRRLFWVPGRIEGVSAGSWRARRDLNPSLLIRRQPRLVCGGLA